MLIFGQDLSSTDSRGGEGVSSVQGQPVFPSGGGGSSARVGQCIIKRLVFQVIFMSVLFKHERIQTSDI